MGCFLGGLGFCSFCVFFLFCCLWIDFSIFDLCFVKKSFVVIFGGGFVVLIDGGWFVFVVVFCFFVVCLLSLCMREFVVLKFVFNGCCFEFLGIVFIGFVCWVVFVLVVILIFFFMFFLVCLVVFCVCLCCLWRLVVMFEVLE